MYSPTTLMPLAAFGIVHCCQLQDAYSLVRYSTTAIDQLVLPMACQQCRLMGGPPIVNNMCRRCHVTGLLADGWVEGIGAAMNMDRTSMEQFLPPMSCHVCQCTWRHVIAFDYTRLPPMVRNTCHQCHVLGGIGYDAL